VVCCNGGDYLGQLPTPSPTRGTAAFLVLNEIGYCPKESAFDRSKEAWQGAIQPIRSETDRRMGKISIAGITIV
jgi:hypothetical protein